MWRRVVCWDATDVSEEHIASIFRAEEKFQQDQQVSLKMEAICFSETWVETERTTRRHIPEDDTPQNHRCANLISYKVSAVFATMLNMCTTRFNVQ
jgi:hypothetical protein